MLRLIEAYSPPQVDGIWLWVFHNEIPIYPIFHVLKGGYTVNMHNYQFQSLRPVHCSQTTSKSRNMLAAQQQGILFLFRQSSQTKPLSEVPTIESHCPLTVS